MSRQYTKVEALSEEVFRRKAAGETNREIGVRFGLSKAQDRAKARSAKSKKRNNELIELRMQVELLRNFLSEAGRR